MLATASQSLPPVTSAYSAEGGFHTVSAADLCCELVGPQPPLVVDVREATEFAQGHVPGAVSVPLSQLSDAARRGDLGGRDAALVVVGNNDRLSQQANVRLRRVCGFSNVRSLAGDVDGWASLGLPLDANH
jgi:rhodanese-related sulfurtransferase